MDDENLMEFAQKWQELGPARYIWLLATHITLRGTRTEVVLNDGDYALSYADEGLAV